MSPGPIFGTQEDKKPEFTTCVIVASSGKTDALDRKPGRSILKSHLKSSLDLGFDEVCDKRSAAIEKLTATNSRPTDELMEAVARNMRRTLYVLALTFDFVRDPSLMDR